MPLQVRYGKLIELFFYPLDAMARSMNLMKQGSGAVNCCSLRLTFISL